MTNKIKTNKPCTFIEALEDSGTPFSYFPVMIPQANGDQETTPTPWRIQHSIDKISHIDRCWKSLGRLTYLVIQLWELSFHFVPLEEVIFRLLTHWWNQIKLPGHRIRFLC